MSLTEQFSTMLAMSAMGIWIGGSMTTYFRLVQSRKRWRWISFFTDVLFWIVQALLVFLTLLYINEGQIRFYIFLALLFGFAFYKSLVENLYKRLLEFVIRIIVKTWLLIKKTFQIIIIKPSFYLLKLLFTSVNMIGKIILSIFILVLTISVYPLKWIYILILPLRTRSWIIQQLKFVHRFWSRLWKK